MTEEILELMERRRETSQKILLYIKIFRGNQEKDQTGQEELAVRKVRRNRRIAQTVFSISASSMDIGNHVAPYNPVDSRPE